MITFEWVYHLNITLRDTSKIGAIWHSLVVWYNWQTPLSSWDRSLIPPRHIWILNAMNTKSTQGLHRVYLTRPQYLSKFSLHASCSWAHIIYGISWHWSPCFLLQVNFYIRVYQQTSVMIDHYSNGTRSLGLILYFLSTPRRDRP